MFQKQTIKKLRLVFALTIGKPFLHDVPRVQFPSKKKTHTHTQQTNKTRTHTHTHLWYNFWCFVFALTIGNLSLPDLPRGQLPAKTTLINLLRFWIVPDSFCSSGYFLPDSFRIAVSCFRRHDLTLTHANSGLGSNCRCWWGRADPRGNSESLVKTLGSPRRTLETPRGSRGKTWRRS